jgi:glycosyltransferase involved in cell wall biosynthesis
VAKYSIILPVKNGMPYVKECVASILGQSYSDFNLLVLDNASTDSTGEWIKSLNDSRIQIFPSASPLTIEQNWGRIISVPRAEFMTMIGHDDVLDSNYLATMDNLIAKYPDASLYQAHFRYIDAEGKEIRKCLPMPERMDPHHLLHDFLEGKTDMMGTGFMMRSRDYDVVGGMPGYPNLLFADMHLWIELSRISCMVTTKEECFSYRLHKSSMTSSSMDVKFLAAFDRLVEYLYKVKTNNHVLSAVITFHADQLLRQYCQGITHRILRTPRKERQTPSIAAIIDQFREYGMRLKGNNKFEPLDSRKIRIGKWIDEHPWAHSLFLLFKKIYNKPVLSR